MAFITNGQYHFSPMIRAQKPVHYLNVSQINIVLLNQFRLVIRESDTFFTLLFTTSVGTFEVKALPPIRTIETSFRLQKYTTPSL